MIEKLFIKECLRKKIITDPAGELVGEKWKSICRKYILTSRQVEKTQQCQDRADICIGHVKEMVEKYLNKAGAPTILCSYFL